MSKDDNYSLTFFNKNKELNKIKKDFIIFCYELIRFIESETNKIYSINEVIKLSSENSIEFGMFILNNCYWEINNWIKFEKEINNFSLILNKFNYLEIY